MKILVTGGAGFVGSNLVKRLVNDGHTVVSIDNYSSGTHLNHIDGVEYICAHTDCINDLINISDIEVVFHLGEYSRVAPSFAQNRQAHESIIGGTFEVLDFCKLNNLKIIYAASSTYFASEGKGHSPYSFYKAYNVELIKNYAEWYGLKYSICYFYNVFGPGYDSSPVRGYESVVSVFEKQWKTGMPLTICGDGKQERVFTYVDDIVDGLIRAMNYPKNEEFQLNNQNVYTILDIAKMFSDNIEFVDARPGDRAVSISTTNNARELLNWNTTMNVDEWINIIKEK